jgi:DNA-binding transcriptional ArsR family regulator
LIAKRKPSPRAQEGPDAALSAIADPTRRAILESLRGGAKPVAAIAETLPISRPAVSQHLKVLRQAGLVFDRAEGTRRVYSIDPKGLGPLRAWLDQFWDEALAAFAAEVAKDQGKERQE